MANTRYEELIKPRYEKIEEWIANGVPERTVAKRLGITQQTFMRYKREHSELRELVRDARLDLDVKVENALQKRAIGERIEETNTVITVNPDGTRTQRIEKKERYIPPDVGAIALYMKNRRILKSWDEELKRLQVTQTKDEIKYNKGMTGND